MSGTSGGAPDQLEMSGTRTNTNHGVKTTLLLLLRIFLLHPVLPLSILFSHYRVLIVQYKTIVDFREFRDVPTDMITNKQIKSAPTDTHPYWVVVG
jgi:hypothetical protein